MGVSLRPCLECFVARSTALGAESGPGVLKVLLPSRLLGSPMSLRWLAWAPGGLLRAHVS